MKYLMLVCTDPEAEPYDPKEDRIGEWVKEYDGRGWHLEGQRLRPPEDAATVRVRNGKPLVVDGPFAETKEGIAGYDLLECPHLDAAIEVASKHPMARFGRIELRPVQPGNLTLTPAKAMPKGATEYFQFVLNEPSRKIPDSVADEVAKWLTAQHASGVFRSGERLAGPEAATSVRIRQNRLVVTDGPFAVTKEVVGGYGVLACRSRQEAIEVSTSHPLAAWGAIEVRAFWPFEG